MLDCEQILGWEYCRRSCRYLLNDGKERRNMMKQRAIFCRKKRARALFHLPQTYQTNRKARSEQAPHCNREKLQVGKICSPFQHAMRHSSSSSHRLGQNQQPISALSTSTSGPRIMKCPHRTIMRMGRGQRDWESEYLHEHLSSGLAI